MFPALAVNNSESNFDDYVKDFQNEIKWNFLFLNKACLYTSQWVK